VATRVRLSLSVVGHVPESGETFKKTQENPRKPTKKNHTLGYDFRASAQKVFEQKGPGSSLFSNYKYEYNSIRKEISQQIWQNDTRLPV
jgi:hypothetical protein